MILSLSIEAMSAKPFLKKVYYKNHILI
ncbi:hypothetical protein PT2222_120115 [Paraburkholderia tropica]